MYMCVHNTDYYTKTNRSFFAFMICLSPQIKDRKGLPPFPSTGVARD